MFRNYLKSYAYLFGMIIIFTFVLSVGNYFFEFSTKIIKILIPIISIFISTIVLGKNTKSKAYMEGIKFTSLYVILSIIISLITKNPFSFKLIISYVLFILIGVVGSMIGINLNKNK